MRSTATQVGCLSVCLTAFCVTTTNCAKTAEPIEMPFGVHTPTGSSIKSDGAASTGRGNLERDDVGNFRARCRPAFRLATAADVGFFQRLAVRRRCTLFQNYVGQSCLPSPSNLSNPGYVMRSISSSRTRNPKVIWEKTRPSRQRITTPQSPQWIQWHVPRIPSKLPLHNRRSPLPSNTPLPRPISLTIPNGIWIQSAVIPQYTFRTDRLTDRETDGQTDRQMV